MQLALENSRVTGRNRFYEVPAPHEPLGRKQVHTDIKNDLT